MPWISWLCSPLVVEWLDRENSSWESAPMVHEIIHGTFRQANLTNESAEVVLRSAMLIQSVMS
jgi:hypothetical protein